MGLRELAERDLGGILEDAATGFGWPITLTDPAGNTASLVGFSNDIAQTIDPGTGEVISGRMASMSLRLSSLYAAGLAIPTATPERNSKPWLVQFDDINGVPYSFTIKNSNPDRALGVVACVLEGYDP
jgi:hypothetical protein